MKAPDLFSSAERFSLYESLVRTPLDFSEKELVAIVQNGRMDARLAEVATSHLRDYWWKYDAELLNKKLRVQIWGAAIRPLLLQILESCEAPQKIRSEFGLWCQQVLRGLKIPPPQLYFIPILRPRSSSLDREVEECLPSFRSSGYFAKDLLFNKGNPGSIKGKPLKKTSAFSTTDLLKISMLEKIRAEIKINQSVNLQKKWGINRNVLSNLRSGRLDLLSLKTLSRILDFL